MDFEVAFAKLQLGDRISFGDGEPKPPEVHARKLRAWHQANGTGILTRKVHDEKGAPSRLEVRISPMEDVCVSMTLIITADSRSANRIELISSPRPGDWLVMDRSSAHRDPELHYVGPDEEKAKRLLDPSTSMERVAAC